MGGRLVRIHFLDYLHSTPILQSLGAITAASLFIWYIYRRQNCKVKNCDQDARLLDFESTSLILSVPSISTITFFEGNLIEVKSYIFNRIHEICRVNPWLCGWLVRVNDRIHLRYNSLVDSSASEKVISVVEDSSLHESMEYVELAKRLTTYSVKIGSILLGSNYPLFKVTVIEISTSRFAIHFSVSHIIGDGHTFYSLYGMLSSDKKPYSLEATRFENYSKRLQQVMAGNDSFNWIVSVGASLGIVRTLFLSFYAPRVVVAPIDLDWVERQKQLYNSQQALFHRDSPAVKFVSTNDIITSSLFKSTRCAVGYMAINFRSRLPELSHFDAGNYEALIAYQPKDFATPSLIRQSFTGNIYRRVYGDETLPNFLDSITANVCILSSWAAFYVDLDLPGARQIYHVPHVKFDFVPFSEICILFRPKKNHLSLLALSRKMKANDFFPAVKID